MIRIRVVALLVAAGLVTGPAPHAQMLPVSALQGQAGLGLALRQLNTTGVVLYATAHPDDENNAVLAALGWGQGIRTIVLTATRGDGGQNEIGPELFDALAVLRTEELLAARQLDSHEQYFARAVDFGYSFSTDETFQKWGRREILADFVRMLRALRPDVVLGMRPDGVGGGQHHQASAILIREAMQAAGDPAEFPEQIKEGLRPWQPRKLYYSGRGGEPGAAPAPGSAPGVAVDTSAFDALLGTTWAELASRARSNHKTQGMTQLLALPGASTANYTLAESSIAGLKTKAESSLFDGIDTTLPGLSALVAGTPPDGLTEGLSVIAASVAAAGRQATADGPAAALKPLAAGLTATRALRSRVGSMAIDDPTRVTIDQRLALKEEQFVQAILLACSLRLDAVADDGLVVAGQPITLTLIAANNGDADVAVRQIGFRGFDAEAGVCRTGSVAARTVYRCEANLLVSKQARLSAPYWKRLPDAARYEFEPGVPFGVPFAPTPFHAQFELDVAGTSITIDRPVEFRYEGNIFSGEKRMELKVVPGVAVTLSPEIAIVPARAARPSARVTRGRSLAGSREFRVTVTNGTKGRTEGEVALSVPEGWMVDPATARVTLDREDEEEPLRFTVTPPAGTKPGEYRVGAAVTAANGRFEWGYQVVEYPHTRRRHVVHAAAAVLKVVDVAVAPGLNVGYVMGVGDQVPLAIEQLGAKVTLLDADMLAWGDLSVYDVIVTGVRAYERRPDLVAHNHRILEYAERGGTVIVQYNKFEFNQAQYGPYPAKVSSARVTDEHAPITILEPKHPVFTWPNTIGEPTWKGWVQERGLYFLGEKDAKYADLVELADPFPYNAGPKRGALVEARVGKGRWIYLGLGLWRQLPAGTDGAYQLLANLVSVGKSAQPKGAARR
jgi:LmbE family N-acetylglucosaminyl deacetylase